MTRTPDSERFPARLADGSLLAIGDTVLAQVMRHPTVRGEVVTIIAHPLDAIVGVCDADGKIHTTTARHCRRVKLDPPPEIDAERMRRLHEAATARAAAYRIALERIVEASEDEPSQGGWNLDFHNVVEAARALLMSNEPEASVAPLRCMLGISDLEHETPVGTVAPGRIMVTPLPPLSPARFGSTDYYRAKPHKAADDLIAALAEARGETRDDGPPEDEPWLGGLRPDGSRR